jgi:hypothetical protein
MIGEEGVANPAAVSAGKASFSHERIIISWPVPAVLWIRIRKDPKLFAGSGSEKRDAPDQKSSKNKQFYNYDVKKIVNLTFSLKSML